MIQKLTKIEETIPEPLKKSMQIHSVQGKKSSRAQRYFGSGERFGYFTGGVNQSPKVQRLNLKPAVEEDDSETINAMLLETIKAKLAVLESIR